MKDCPFCNIVNNIDKEKFRIISLGPDHLVMLTLNPESRGHFLVLPKKHHEKISDLPNLGKFFQLVNFLAERMTKKLASSAYTIKINNQLFLLEKRKSHVGHIHFHVIPRYKNNKQITNSPKRATKKDLARLKKILTS